MTAPVNLNKFRKERGKANRAKQADENRVRFGRTKAEKKLAEARENQASKTLDGHRLNDDE